MIQEAIQETFMLLYSTEKKASIQTFLWVGIFRSFSVEAEKIVLRKFRSISDVCLCKVVLGYETFRLTDIQ